MFSSDTLTDHCLCKYLRSSFVPHYGLYLSPKSHPCCDGLVWRFSAGILYNATLGSDIATWCLRWFWSGPELALHDFVFHFLLPNRRTPCPPLCPRLNFSMLALGSSTPSPGHGVSGWSADCLIWLLILCLFHRRRRRGGACPGDRLHMQRKQC